MIYNILRIPSLSNPARALIIIFARHAARPTEAAGSMGEKRGACYIISIAAILNIRAQVVVTGSYKDQMFPIHLFSICVLRYETAKINGPVSIGDSSIGRFRKTLWGYIEYILANCD